MVFNNLPVLERALYLVLGQIVFAIDPAEIGGIVVLGVFSHIDPFAFQVKHQIRLVLEICLIATAPPTALHPFPGNHQRRISIGFLEPFDQLPAAGGVIAARQNQQHQGRHDSQA